jgi:hypothetical protein
MLILFTNPKLIGLDNSIVSSILLKFCNKAIKPFSLIKSRSCISPNTAFKPIILFQHWLEILLLFFLIIVPFISLFNHYLFNY